MSIYEQKDRIQYIFCDRFANSNSITVALCYCNMCELECDVAVKLCLFAKENFGP